MRKTSILKAGTAPIALGLMLAAAPAFAQDQTDSEEAEAPANIIVTGSRIARPDLDAPSPVTVVTAEQIQLTGTQTLETLLNDLPQVVPGATTSSNNPSGTFGTIDLRGLGPQRTLILLNGERLPPSTTTGVVDISLIPVQLIRQVEVVTGGASAVYGSDAIGGVVNFVLADDFEGVELTGQYGINEDGRGNEYSYGMVVGGNFADGRGNLVVSANYYNREAISTNAYDFTRISGTTLYDPATQEVYLALTPDDVRPGSTYTGLGGGGSATGPWGSVSALTGNPFRNLSTLLPDQFAAANTDCNAATPGVAVNTGALSFNDQGALTPNFTSLGSGALTGATGSFCGLPIRSIGSSRYNFAPDNLNQLAYDRYNFVTVGSYEFSDKTRLNVFGAYTESRLQQQLAPTPAQAPATGFTIDPTRAQFIPADLRIALNSRVNPDGAFVYNRRFNETGPRVGTIESRNINARAILEHDINEKWTANAIFSWGRNSLDTRAVGNVNRTAVEQGVNGCRNAAGVVNGPGILPGCVPVSIFGPNTLTPAMVNFIQTDTLDIARFEQVRVAANLTGELFELPGGPAAIAVGAEHRKDTGSFIPDDAKRRGEIIGFNAANPQVGGITVNEVYGEIRLPVLGGDGFPDLLSFEAGARYSDYNTIGGLFNWKAGVEFAPVEWIRFRASYNKAARAPNVTELFQAGDQGFPQVTDPCSRGGAATDPRSATLLARCQASGIPAANLPTYTQQNPQIQSFAFGQGDLSEERAETWTAGAVISPDWFPLGRLNLTADYYDITLRGAIQALSAQFYINQCFTAAVQSDCNRIVRGPDGQIASVNTGRRNSPDANGPLVIRGIDIGADWVIPLNEIFGGSSDARLRFSNVFTYTMDFINGGTNVVGTTDGGGFSGVSSKFKNNLTAAYETEGFTGQLRWVYATGARDDLAVFSGPGGFGVIPDLSYFDLSLRTRINDRINLTGIVGNLFDERAPLVNGISGEQSNTSASFYANIFYGRNFTVQTSISF
ncbi:TonB-dependent receptor domain-containing protein [Erythrobacter oryzae]|uniref:TonB-dependent receptor domain-containing protein n=1 Tax=Erythrobacter oryzae TaxID=3019556 RepID=UPI002552D572|nr:TonB-dependent receptor [Erythrobacter sp. COR-2]